MINVELARIRQRELLREADTARLQHLVRSGRTDRPTRLGRAKDILRRT